MRRARYAEERWYFIEKIQDWFSSKNHFWLVLSILAFGGIVILQVFLVYASQANPQARIESEFLVIPLLALFVTSIFWRSIFQCFLSIAGALLTYGGIFWFYTRDAATSITVPYVANRLGYGIKHYVVISPDAVADRYLIVGIFAMAFCLAMAIRPGFFKPKNPDDLPYSLWRQTEGSASPQSSLTRLIPVSSLLTYEEKHMVARYRYVIVVISGRKYLVTPYEWIPEGSVLTRDEETNSFIGIL